MQNTMKLKTALGLILAGAMIFLAREGNATIIIHTPFAQLCQDADVIIEATVTNKMSRYLDPINEDFIVTDVVFEDIVMLKGQAITDPFTYTYSGGVIDDMASAIVGMPDFEIGERKVIFLSLRDDGSFSLTGFWEGVFTKRDILPGEGTVIESAEGFFVEGFDAASGELIFSTPSDAVSKPTLGMGPSDFSDLIVDLAIEAGVPKESKELNE
jgi:hypothetical protein